MLIFTPNALSSSAIITAKGKDAMPYIQDFTKAMCQTQASSNAITVRDRRDGQDYTVRYINGNCWMTRNLAIGCNGSGNTYGASVKRTQLTNTYSNVSTSWYTPTASLDKSDNTSGCTTSSTSDCNSYTTARMKCSTTYGAWYNYAAASAGTITGSSNSTNATHDVCPAGWRLPTYDEGKTIVGYQGIFNPSYNQSWMSGSLYTFTTIGVWWYSTSKTYTTRYNLYYEDGALKATDPGDFAGYRTTGYSVRCIRSS